MSNHRAAALVSEAARMDQDRVLSAVAWGESDSRSLFGHVVQKGLPLFSRQKFEES